MAEAPTLGNMTVTLTLSVNDAPLEVQSFELPVRIVSDATLTRADRTSVFVDRGETRDRIHEATTKLIEFAEQNLTDEPESSVILTCEVCGSQLATSTVAVLRHEGNGSHVLDPA